MLLTTFKMQRDIKGYFYCVSSASLYDSWYYLYSKMAVLANVPLSLKFLKNTVVTFVISNLLLSQSAGNFLCPHFVQYIAPLLKNPQFRDENIESQRLSSVTYCLKAWTLEQGTSLVAQTLKHLPTVQDTRVQSLGQEGLLEKEMAPHSSILAWKIPWMEEPGRLQSMGLQRVGHD